MSKLIQLEPAAALTVVPQKDSPQEIFFQEIGSRLDLKHIDDRERAFLAICQQIHREFTGCNAPFHEFMNHVISEIQYGRWPTPDDVREYLDEFKQNWQEMCRDTALFVAQYPEACKVATEEEV